MTIIILIPGAQASNRRERYFSGLVFSYKYIKGLVLVNLRSPCHIIREDAAVEWCKLDFINLLQVIPLVTLFPHFVNILITILLASVRDTLILLTYVKEHVVNPDFTIMKWIACCIRFYFVVALLTYSVSSC